MLAIGLVLAVGVGALLWMHAATLHHWADAGASWVRELGPVTFFTAMALLPALGVPVSAFTLTAGPVFEDSLGMPLVLGLVAGAMAANLAITYVLARWVLRPWVLKLCNWLGYRVPEVSRNDQVGLVVLVRVTPGPPYVFQGYLLGLAAIPFQLYFWISWIISTLYAFAFVLFGNALMEGKGRMALVASGLFVGLVIGGRWLRRRFSEKSTTAVADPSDSH